MNSSEIFGQANDLEAGLYNVGVGSILGGVGAVINKEPDEKFGKTFLKGLGQGALGGYLVFESKRLVRSFARTGNFNYVWPSKIVNSAGASIIENAAANRDFWARWHLNIAFNRIEINTKESFKVSLRIMPFDLAATAYQAIDATPDWNMSFRTGTFVFRKRVIWDDPGYRGSAFGNSIQLLHGISGNMALPHEIIHTYQYEQLSGFNSFLFDFEEKYKNKIAQKIPIVGTYHKIFYSDYNLLLMNITSLISNPNRDSSGFIESEARYFGSEFPYN
ncbi:hypothetical protein MKO06_06035 [Gramella sp. GC03-9]|uniref:Uncharacterized protein n=1 Tax=Christiangramia oceanisediminis TaxID=2920386 RepID=A0A9X2KXE5_9FLAO|nr:hypothetical protein [Gramella oceanisediminis]MCP9199456.1 hypothetical protein [Gramella oceanisediminis]